MQRYSWDNFVRVGTIQKNEHLGENNLIETPYKCIVGSANTNTCSFYGRAMILLPVLPTLHPANSMISLFLITSHSYTFIFASLSPQPQPTDMYAFTKFHGKPANSSHILSHERIKTTESRRTKGIVGDMMQEQSIRPW